MKSSLLLAVLLFSPAPPASAITRTWDDGGADDNFNNPANWNPTGAPVDGDDLVFPSTTAAATVTNNLTGRTFGSLTIQNAITIAGNAFTLTGGITASGSGILRSEVTIDANITLGADQTFTCTTGSLVFGGNVAFGSRTLTVSSGRTVTFQGITGSSTAGSRLIKTGTGLLRLDTSAILVTNQPFTLSTGTLDVDGFLQTPLTMTAGTLTGQGNLGFSLDASGGDIIPDSGDLDVAGVTTLRGDVNLRVALLGASNESQLSCGGTVTIQDQATLEVISTAYTPVRGDVFQLLQKSPAGAITGTFSNAAANSEIPAGTSVMRLSYAGGNGNDLTLTTISTTRTWDGGVVINDNWDEPDNWTQNIAPQAGDVLVFPAGIDASDRGLDNNFPADTIFRQIIFNGDDYTVRGNRIRLTHGIVLGFANGQANFDVDVVLAASQTFDFGASPGSRVLHFDLIDNVDTNGRTLTLAGQGRMDGSVNGSGGVTFPAESNVTMTAVNRYDGITRVLTGGFSRFGRLPFTTIDHAPGSSTGATEISGEFENNNEFEAVIPMQVPENFILKTGAIFTSEGIAWTGGVSTENYNGNFELQGPGTMTIDITNGGFTHFDGAFTGTGDLTIQASDTGFVLDRYLPVRFRGSQANTFAGSLTLNEGKFILEKSNPAVLAVSCAVLNLTTNGDDSETIVETQQDEQIADDCHVTMLPGTLLHIGDLTARTETIGSLTINNAFVGHEGSGGPDSLLVIKGDITAQGGRAFFNLDVNLTATPCTLNTVVNATCVFGKDLRRTGGGTMTKTGAGTVRFSGPTAVPIDLHAGTAFFFGDSSASAISLNGGELGGFGPCGGITAASGGGRIAPSSNLAANPDTAVLTTASLILNPATTLETQVETIVTGTGYDQLSATGTVGLNGATLDLRYLPGFNIAIGQSIFPLLNDGTDAITGTFAGLPQGSFIPIPVANGGGGWIISYTGGTGNDIALTRVANPPPAEVIPTVTSFTFGNPDANGNRPVTIAGKGTPGASYQLETSVDLFPLPTWTTEGSAQTANATTGALSFTTTASPPVRQRQFWRFRKL